MENNTTNIKISIIHISIIAVLSVLNIGFGFAYDFYYELIFRTFILIALAMMPFIIKKEKAARIICLIVLAILFGKDIYELFTTYGSILQIIASILRLTSVLTFFIILNIKLAERVRNILTQTGTFMYLMAFILDAVVIAFSLTPSLQQISMYSNGTIIVRAVLGMISWLAVFFSAVYLSATRTKETIVTEKADD